MTNTILNSNEGFQTKDVNVLSQKSVELSNQAKELRNKVSAILEGISELKHIGITESSNIQELKKKVRKAYKKVKNVQSKIDSIQSKIPNNANQKKLLASKQNLESSLEEIQEKIDVINQILKPLEQGHQDVQKKANPLRREVADKKRQLKKLKDRWNLAETNLDLKRMRLLAVFFDLQQRKEELDNFYNICVKDIKEQFGDDQQEELRAVKELHTFMEEIGEQLTANKQIRKEEQTESDKQVKKEEKPGSDQKIEAVVEESHKVKRKKLRKVMSACKTFIQNFNVAKKQSESNEQLELAMGELRTFMEEVHQKPRNDEQGRYPTIEELRTTMQELRIAKEQKLQESEELCKQLITDIEGIQEEQSLTSARIKSLHGEIQTSQVQLEKINAQAVTLENEIHRQNEKVAKLLSDMSSQTGELSIIDKQLSETSSERENVTGLSYERDELRYKADKIWDSAKKILRTTSENIPLKEAVHKIIKEADKADAEAKFIQRHIAQIKSEQVKENSMLGRVKSTFYNRIKSIIAYLVKVLVAVVRAPVDLSQRGVRWIRNQDVAST